MRQGSSAGASRNSHTPRTPLSSSAAAKTALATVIADIALGYPGVKRKMDNRLFEFSLRQSIGPRPGNVSVELFCAAARDEAGDGDEAAVPWG